MGHRFRGCVIWVALCSAGLSLAESPKPDHHAQKGFVNPYVTEPHGGFFKLLRARFGGDWQGYDPQRDVVAQTDHAVDLDVELNAKDAHMRVTWVGHSTVLLQYQGVNVLTDPIFSDFASPVQFAGPRRITAPALPLKGLPPIDAVVISHDHYDHLDTRSIRALGDAPMYFVPLGIKRWMVDKGIAEARIKEMDWWETVQLPLPHGQGSVQFTATPTQHFSGRSLTDRNRTLWSSWAIAWPDFAVWFGGDTGYNEQQFKSIGERLGPFDFGIIPIGAYKPRWFMGPIHVDPAEAVKIHQDIRARRSFGVHWGTFVLAGEGVLTPPLELAGALSEAGLKSTEFEVFAVGETRVLAPSR